MSTIPRTLSDLADQQDCVIIRMKGHNQATEKDIELVIWAFGVAYGAMTRDVALEPSKLRRWAPVEITLHGVPQIIVVPVEAAEDGKWHCRFPGGACLWFDAQQVHDTQEKARASMPREVADGAL